MAKNGVFRKRGGRASRRPEVPVRIRQRCTSCRRRSPAGGAGALPARLQAAIADPASREAGVGGAPPSPHRPRRGSTIFFQAAVPHSDSKTNRSDRRARDYYSVLLLSSILHTCDPMYHSNLIRIRNSSFRPLVMSFFPLPSFTSAKSSTGPGLAGDYGLGIAPFLFTVYW